MGLFPRRKHPRGRSHTVVGGLGMTYLRARKNSIFFFALFVGALLFGSIYAAKDSRGPQLILSMVTNHIQVQAMSGYWRILLGCLGKNIGFIIFLYFCANCLQGRWLALLVPGFYGLSVGAMMTALLYQHGTGAMAYLATCVLLPRFIQLILLMAACNQTIKLSQGLSTKNPAGDQVFLLFGAASIAFSLLEALLISRCTGLLTYL